MRSVTVVLPASIWAMIPMFRVFASGTCRGTVVTFPGLPLEMAEGLVGLRHLVGVLSSLDRCAEVVRRVDELRGELLAHALATALARGLDQPAHAERQPAVAPDLDRDLVCRATDAPGLDLDDRRRVPKGGLHDLDAGPAGRRLGPCERLAEDPLREATL